MLKAHAATPLGTDGRIPLLDTIRGIAILGILLMNMPYFGQPYIAYYDLRVLNELQTVNETVWRLMMLFFEGSFRAIFCILFGAGVILLVNRLDKYQINNLSADIYYKRLLWLILFGVIDEYLLLWPGDILFPYAIAGLVLFPFRNKSASFLLRAFVFCMLIYHLSLYVKESGEADIRHKGLAAKELKAGGGLLTISQENDLRNWQRFEEDNSLAGKQKYAALQTSVFRNGYSDIAKMFDEINIEIQSVYLYLFGFWDYLGAMFLGMALFKMRFLTGEKTRLSYCLTMVTAYVIGIFAGYLHTRLLFDHHFDSYEVFQHKIIDFYQIHRIGLALGHLSLIILLFKAGLFKKTFYVLAKTGRMALTNYLLQTILCTGFFFGYGLGYFNRLERYQLYYVMLVIWVIEIVFSVLWLKYFTMGPMEWAWRCLTYGVRLRLRRAENKSAMF